MPRKSSLEQQRANSAQSVNAPIWRVTRFCCRSGMCIDCKLRGNLYGDMKRRKRITHADKLVKAQADVMAKNWWEFGATTELM